MLTQQQRDIERIVELLRDAGYRQGDIPLRLKSAIHELLVLREEIARLRGKIRNLEIRVRLVTPDTPI